MLGYSLLKIDSVIVATNLECLSFYLLMEGQINYRHVSDSEVLFSVAI